MLREKNCCLLQETHGAHRRVVLAEWSVSERYSRW